jgi:hypothetical protein
VAELKKSAEAGAPLPSTGASLLVKSHLNHRTTLSAHSRRLSDEEAERNRVTAEALKHVRMAHAVFSPYPLVHFDCYPGVTARPGETAAD